MFGIRARSLATAAVAAGLSLALAGAANASQAQGFFGSNYTFGDGALGFRLASHGGPINPGVIVGFNPQPDPPGDGDDGLLIALLNPSDPMLISPSQGGAFTFLIGLDLGDGSVVPLPDAPNSDGFTGFRESFDGHDISVSLQFGPGRVNPESWVGFNPQPDPPGDVLGGAFQFENQVDPWMAFRITVDGQDLSFTLDNSSGAPEPSAWAMMIAGFGGVGAVLRQRRRAATLAA